MKNFTPIRVYLPRRYCYIKLLLKTQKYFKIGRIVPPRRIIIKDEMKIMIFKTDILFYFNMDNKNNISVIEDYLSYLFKNKYIILNKRFDGVFKLKNVKINYYE